MKQTSEINCVCTGKIASPWTKVSSGGWLTVIWSFTILFTKCNWYRVSYPIHLLVVGVLLTIASVGFIASIGVLITVLAVLLHLFVFIMRTERIKRMLIEAMVAKSTISNLELSVSILVDTVFEARGVGEFIRLILMKRQLQIIFTDLFTERRN